MTIRNHQTGFEIMNSLEIGKPKPKGVRRQRDTFYNLGEGTNLDNGKKNGFATMHENRINAAEQARKDQITKEWLSVDNEAIWHPFNIW